MFYVPFDYSNRNFFVLIVIDGNLYHEISTLSTFTIYEFLNTVDVVICNSFCIFVMLIRAFTLSFRILFETHLWISFKGPRMFQHNLLFLQLRLDTISANYKLHV